MEGSFLKVGERYLFRLRGKQVPVVFNGKVTAFGKGWENIKPGESRLMFTPVAGGDAFYRRTARALSKHYDECVLVSRNFSTCNCITRLAKESNNVSL